MLVVYGIPNCDIVKKSIDWLKKEKIPFRFHNFKSEGVSKKKIVEWIDIAGLDVVINKRSTTWRNLPAEVQSKMGDPNEAAKVAMAETSIIKRPVVESSKGLVIGFNEQEYQKTFTF